MEEHISLQNVFSKTSIALFIDVFFLSEIFSDPGCERSYSSTYNLKKSIFIQYKIVESVGDLIVYKVQNIDLTSAQSVRTVGTEKGSKSSALEGSMGTQTRPVFGWMQKGLFSK